jgi:hypothetical protein
VALAGLLLSVSLFLPSSVNDLGKPRDLAGKKQDISNPTDFAAARVECWLSFYMQVE